MKFSNGKAILTVILILTVVLWSKFGNLNRLLERYSVQGLHGLTIIFLAILSTYILITKKRKQALFAVLAILAAIPSILFFINNPFSPQFSIIYCVGVIALPLIFLSSIAGARKDNSI